MRRTKAVGIVIPEIMKMVAKCTSKETIEAKSKRSSAFVFRGIEKLPACLATAQT
jgi:hypothetical protein